LNRDHIVPAADAVGGLWNEQQFAWFNATKDNKSAQLRREFWSLVDGLSDNWAVLDRASKEFKTVRAKWIAHYEVYDDPTKEQFRGFDVPTLFEFYKKLEQPIGLIARTLSDLALVLNRTDISIDEFEQIVGRDARSVRSNANDRGVHHRA
jgi:hypothetical protein